MVAVELLEVGELGPCRRVRSRWLLRRARCFTRRIGTVVEEQLDDTSHELELDALLAAHAAAHGSSPSPSSRIASTFSCVVTGTRTSSVFQPTTFFATSALHRRRPVRSLSGGFPISSNRSPADARIRCTSHDTPPADARPATAPPPTAAFAR